jgi:hypothetical protein
MTDNQWDALCIIVGALGLALATMVERGML